MLHHRLRAVSAVALLAAAGCSGSDETASGGTPGAGGAATTSGTGTTGTGGGSTGSTGSTGSGGQASLEAIHFDGRFGQSDAQGPRFAWSGSSNGARFFPSPDPADGWGCDYHPSQATHEKLGQVLTSALQQELGW